MASGTLLAALFFSVVKFVSKKDLIEIYASSHQVPPSYPLCDSPSHRVQSCYVRTLSDLPWQGIAVRILLHVRRFFCDLSACPRKVFAERLCGVAKAYARRTSRLADVIELIGFVSGGEGGARTAVKLGIQTSPDTFICAVRRSVLLPILTSRVLGADDW